MDPRMPNEDERKKLQKMARSHQLYPFYTLSLAVIFWINEYFLDHYPALGDTLAVVILLALIYLLLSLVLLKRCPRCSAWGTPPTGGNCPKCGLYLDPSRMEP